MEGVFNTRSANRWLQLAPSHHHACAYRLTELTLSNCGLNSKYSADLGAALALNTTIAKLNLRNNPLGSTGVADIINGLRKQIDTVRRMLVPSPRAALDDDGTADSMAADPSLPVSRTGSRPGSSASSRPGTVNRMGGAQHIKRRTTAEMEDAKSRVAAERAELEFQAPLKSLNLTNTDITDASSSRSNMLDPQLSHVVGNRSGTKALAGYLLNPHCGLARLNLSKNEIDDHCMAPLIRALGYNSSLVSLSFKQCGLGLKSSKAICEVAMRSLPPEIPDANQFEDDFAALGVPCPFAVFRPIPPAAYQGKSSAAQAEEQMSREWTASGLPSRPETPALKRVREAGEELSTIALWSPEHDARPETQSSLASYVTARTHGTYSTWNWANPMRVHDGLSPINLMKLNLRSCNIGDAGAAAIGSLMKQRSNLRELIVTQNGITTKGLRHICLGVRVGSLVSLVVSQNPLHVEGGFMLADTLQGNACKLRELHAGYCLLTDNGTDPRGAIAIAKSLSVNTELRLLALPGNCLTSQKMSFLRTREAVVQEFGKMLERNTTLELLDVSENWVGAAGQQALQRGLERAPRATRHASVIAEALSEWIRASFKKRNGTMADLVAREDSIAMQQGRELLETFGNPYALTRTLAEKRHDETNDGSVSGRVAYDIQIIKNVLQSAAPEGLSSGAAAAQYAAVLAVADTQRVVLGDDGQPMTLLATDSTYEVTEHGYKPVHKPNTHAKYDKAILRDELLAPDLPPYRPPSQLRGGREVVSADWRPAKHLATQMARNKQWRDVAASTPDIGRLSAAEAAQLRMSLPVPSSAPSLSAAGIIRPGTLRGVQMGMLPSALSHPPSRLDAPNSLASVGSLGSAASSDMSVGELAVMLGSASKGRGLPDSLETAMHGMQLKAGYGKRPPTNRKYYEQYHYGRDFNDAPGNESDLNQAEIARRANVRDGGASAASDLSSLFSSGFGAAPVSLQEALKIATAGGAYDDDRNLQLKQARSEAALAKATQGSLPSPTRVSAAAAKSPVPKLNLLPLRAHQRAQALNRGTYPRISSDEVLGSSRSFWSAGDISDGGTARFEANASPPHNNSGRQPASESKNTNVEDVLIQSPANSMARLNTANLQMHDASPGTAGQVRAGLTTAALHEHQAALHTPLGTEEPWHSQALQGSMPGTAATGQRQNAYAPRRAATAAMQSDAAGPAGFLSVATHTQSTARHRSGMAARLGGSLVRAEWDSRPPLHPPSSFLWVKPRLIKEVLDYLGVERSVKY